MRSLLVALLTLLAHAASHAAGPPRLTTGGANAEAYAPGDPADWGGAPPTTKSEGLDKIVNEWLRLDNAGCVTKAPTGSPTGAVTCECAVCLHATTTGPDSPSLWASISPGTNNQWFNTGVSLGVEGHVIANEGIPIAQQDALNCLGPMVDCVNDAGNNETELRVSLVFEDEGAAVTERARVDFVGGGVTVSDVGGETRVSVPSPFTSTATSLAELKTCIETAVAARDCRMAPGTYNGTLYAVLPNLGTVPQHLTISLAGATIDPVGAAAVNNGVKAVFQILLNNWAHDSTLQIADARIEGSSDTDETVLALVKTADTNANAIGKVLLSNVQAGQEGGSARSYHYDRQGGTGAQLTVVNSVFEATGYVFEHESAADNAAIEIMNSRFLGVGDRTRANNMCLGLGTNRPSAGADNAYIQVLNSQLQNCGGASLVASTVAMSAAAHQLGTGTEDDVVFLIDANAADMRIRATTGSGAAWSDAPMFFMVRDLQHSINVDVVDEGCGVFGGNGGILFDADVTEINGDYRGRVTGGSSFGCNITPFGPNMLSLDIEGFRGEVEAFGEVYTYQGPTLFRRRVDSQPFVWRGSVGAGASRNAISLATSIVGVSPTTNNACFLASGAGAAACSSELSVWIPVDSSRPLYINEFGCVLEDQEVTNADEDDAIDTILQKQSVLGDATTWANVTATPGQTGRIRWVDDTQTERHLTELGYAYEQVTRGAVVFPAGQVAALRVLAHVEVDTAPTITNGATALRDNCWIRGWN